jgi:hypothetical protein
VDGGWREIGAALFRNRERPQRHTSTEPEWGSIVGAEFGARAYFWISLSLGLASGVLLAVAVLR